VSVDRMNKLFHRLACPVTKGPIQISPVIMAGSHVMAGTISSTEGIVGAIDNFKPKFTSFDPVHPAPLKTITHMPVWSEIESDKLAPGWTVLDQHWRLCPIGETLRFDRHARVRIKFGAHPWSGIVSVNGEMIDLYHANSLVPYVVEMQGPVEICATDERNPQSRGKQILLESIAFETNEMRSAGYERVPVNRARPFRARAMELLAELPKTGFMLDIGGGRRMLDDERYFNMEYDVFDEADLYGDAQNLPFKDNSIDFIHSTAVFEHLPEPQKAAQEIHRVLKPGGKAYIVTAFMQPVHSEPQHFYNASAFGLDNWFNMFEDRTVSWGGHFSTMMMRLARAGAKGAPAAKMKSLQDALEAMNEHVTRESLMFVAPETTIEVRK
jgi:SAM-dependent methyltransferase